MLVTLSGRVMEVMPLQSEKAYSPITVIPSGITISPLVCVPECNKVLPKITKSSVLERASI